MRRDRDERAAMGVRGGLQSANQLVLAVDDDLDNLRLVSKTLEHEGYRVEQATHAEAALEKIKSIRPDLILLDVNMPGISGIQALEKIRAREDYVPIIFVSGRSATADIIRGLDAGADDYICKPFEPLELLARVRAQLRIKDLTDRLREANSRLQELVDIDDLTGLFNMRSVYERLDSEIARAKRFKRAVGVIMMDMDNFKNVNDTNDHLFGSFVLSEVGKLIRENIRREDFAARYGGDEFLIVLSETTLEGAERFAERLRSVIESYTFSIRGSSMHLTASLGLVMFEPALNQLDARSIVRYADNALYEAKKAGKNSVCCFDTRNSRLRLTS
jgi:two-component system cell cycle response regulator